MMQRQNLTPSQIAFHEAAKERAARRLEAAWKRQTPNKQIAAPAPPKMKPAPAAPVILPFFNTATTLKILWEGEYCVYAGGNTTLARVRKQSEIMRYWLQRFPGMTGSKVRSKQRTQHVVLPRHVIIYMIKEETELSFPEIGRFFNIDHTSVIFAVNKIQKMIDQGTLEAAIEKWQIDAERKSKGRK